MDLVATQDLEIELGKSAVASVATVGCLDGCTVDLVKDDITLNRTTTKAAADAAVATYSGYAQGDITWSAPTISDDGEIEFLGTTDEFRPTGSGTTNSIYGLYVKNAGNTKLLFAGAFDDAPLPMASTLDSIVVTLRFRPRSNSIVAMIS